MNPYKILNIPQSSSTEDIRLAYFNIVKEYSVDKASSDEEIKLFTEKLSEANEAYRMITNSLTCEEVRDLIDKDDFISAESKLNLISDYSSAEWNYLKGILQIKKGWVDSGLTHLQKSVNINPYNDEYKGALDKLKGKLSTGRSAYTPTNKQGMSLCANKHK